MSATATPLARSARTLVRAKPSRSTTAPPRKSAITVGGNVKNAVTPVSAALPVVSRTNQGTATCATTLPVSEMESEAKSAKRGRRDRVTTPVFYW
jgi:hypothetical protein